MPNIKPEERSKFALFLNSREGEFCLVALSCAALWALSAEIFARIAIYISDTLYPFTYSFFHTPLHAFLPRLAYQPPLAANLLFGAAFGYTVYLFEKNIFYRRMSILLRAAFGAVAACVIVFLSGLLGFADEAVSLGLLSPLLLSAEANELPMLLAYYFFATIEITAYCDAVRRRVFLLP